MNKHAPDRPDGGRVGLDHAVEEGDQVFTRAPGWIAFERLSSAASNQCAASATEADMATCRTLLTKGEEEWDFGRPAPAACDGDGRLQR